MKIVLGLFLPLYIFAQSYGLATFVENANKEQEEYIFGEVRNIKEKAYQKKKLEEV